MTMYMSIKHIYPESDSIQNSLPPSLLLLLHGSFTPQPLNQIVGLNAQYTHCSPLLQYTLLLSSPFDCSCDDLAK